MFLVDTPERAYADPWLQPLPERLAALGRGRRRVAYYYEAPNNSTFRYRAYNMAQVLNDQADEISASYFFHDDLHRVDEIAQVADVLVICRSGYDHNIARLMQRFRVRGKPVRFDIDDFVFDTRYAHLIIDTLALDKNDPRVWDDWFGMIGRMGHTLRLADSAITTNAFLAQQIQAFSGKPVAVVPNFMNREQLDLSAQVYADKQQRGFERDGTVSVGYFSGSPSHNLDFALVEPALAALLESEPKVRLMMVGYIEPSPTLAKFGGRILRYPFHDYVNLQRLLSRAEINLMPLQANAFTDSKSELKYFEAAAVGTLSIASPSRNYAAAIDDGVTGWLSRAHQWQRIIERALARMSDYTDMAERAHDDALAKFSWTTQRSSIVRALHLE